MDDETLPFPTINAVSEEELIQEHGILYIVIPPDEQRVSISGPHYALTRFGQHPRQYGRHCAEDPPPRYVL